MRGPPPGYLPMWAAMISGPSGHHCPATAPASARRGFLLSAPKSWTPAAAHMAGMNAYDRQLLAAIDHLDTMNPMFDFDGADRATQARQLKTWWGRPLADDHLHGHDPEGPIAAPEAQLTDRQLVLLSALQRGARAATGPCAMTAQPEAGDGLSLTVAGHGLAASMQLSEGKNGITAGGGLIPAAGSDDTWFAALLYRSTYMEAPAADLVDLLALSAAFASSPLAGQPSSIRRTSYETLEAGEDEITLDWSARRAIPDEAALTVLTAATGMTADEVQGALDAVMHAAVEHGHSVPEAPVQATLAPVPAHGPGHSSAAAAILAGMGIAVGSASVIGIPPGGSMSIEVSAGDNGLSITERQTSVGTVTDAEEAFMAECAASLGIPVETFRDIIQGDDEADGAERDD